MVEVVEWGVLPESHASRGETVHLVTLCAGAHTCRVATLGCTIVDLLVDRGDGESPSEPSLRAPTSPHSRTNARTRMHT
jgi:hypothetical protein